MPNTFSLNTAAKPGQIHLPWHQARDAPTSSRAPERKRVTKTPAAFAAYWAHYAELSLCRDISNLLSLPRLFRGAKRAKLVKPFGGTSPPDLSTSLALLQGKMYRCNGVVFLQYSACANNIALPESAFNECPTSIFPLLQRTNLPLAWRLAPASENRTHVKFFS
jgi:hypothetical protein